MEHLGCVCIHMRYEHFSSASSATINFTVSFGVHGLCFLESLQSAFFTLFFCARRVRDIHFLATDVPLKAHNMRPVCLTSCKCLLHSKESRFYEVSDKINIFIFFFTQVQMNSYFATFYFSSA